MHKYSHLNLFEREIIYGLKEKGVSLRDIAKEVGRDVSTISREFSGHKKFWKSYIPCVAQREADRTGFRQRQRAALKNPLIFLFVRKHLREDKWSPETISGRLPLMHSGETICTESIYRYIYLNPKTKREKLWQYLELHRRKRMRKNGRKVKVFTKFSEAIPIDLRPEIINKRLELGHWETDNMEGVRSDKTAVSVSVERVTRKIKLARLNSHKAGVKTDAVIKSLKEEDNGFVRSITYDRGPENSGYKEISDRLNTVAYACNPYHSWEKGTVENTIKRIRKFVPKGVSVDNVTQEYLTALENKFNNTPRKVLGFLTPNEYYERIHLAPTV